MRSAVNTSGTANWQRMEYSLPQVTVAAVILDQALSQTSRSANAAAVAGRTVSQPSVRLVISRRSRTSIPR
jgi:hypothetical protein